MNERIINTVNVGKKREIKIKLCVLNFRNVKELKPVNVFQNFIIYLWFI